MRGRIPALLLFLFLFDFTFVQLAFSTHTMNIVLIKDLAAALFALLLFGIWIVMELAERGIWTLAPSPANLPMAATLLFLAHSAATSPLPAASVEEFSRIFVNFSLVLFLTKFLQNRSALRCVLGTVAFIAALSVSYALGQSVDFDALEWIGRNHEWGFPGWGGQAVFVSTHGSQNFFSATLLASVPLLVGWWLATHRGWLQLVLPTLLLGMLLCIAISESRGAYLGVLLGGTTFTVGLLWIRPPLRWKSLCPGLALALVIAVAVATTHPDRTASIGRDAAQVLEGLGSINSYRNQVRVVFWQTFLDGGLREPLLGRGLGVSNERMPESRPNWYHHVGVSHNTMHAHNEWFEWILEGGALGTALYLWLILVLFVHWVRTLARSRDDPDRLILLGSGIGFFAQFVESWFNPSSRWTSSAMAYWLSAGILTAWPRLDIEKEEDHVPFTSPFLPVVAAFGGTVILFAVWVSWRAWTADHHHRVANAFTERSDRPQDLRNGRNAAETCVERNPFHLSNYYKLAYAHLALGGREESFRAYRRLQEFAPNFAQIHINLSYVKHSLNDRYGSSWERDRAAIIEDNTRNHIAAAEYWAMLGRMERVLPHLRHALKIDQDDDDGSRSVLFYRHDDIHYRLAQALGVTGDVARAMRELENALSRNPGNQDALFQLLQLYRQSGQHAAAEAKIEEIRRTMPDSELRHLAEADRHLRNGNLDAALVSARALSEHLPWPAAGSGTLSPAIQTVARIAEASIGASRDLPTAYALIGRCHAAMGSYDRANQILKEATRLAPGDLWITRLKSDVLARTSR